MFQYLKPYFIAKIAQISVVSLAAFKLYSPPYDRVYWNSNVKRI